MSKWKILSGLLSLMVVFLLAMNPVLALNDTGTAVSSDTFDIEQADTTASQFRQGFLDTAFGWTELLSGFENDNDPVRAIYVGIRNSLIRHLYGPVKMARSQIKYFDFRSDTGNLTPDLWNGSSSGEDTGKTQNVPRVTVKSDTSSGSPAEPIDGGIPPGETFSGPRFLLRGVTKEEIFAHIERQLLEEGFTQITRSDTLVTFEKDDVNHSMVEKARLSFKLHQKMDLVRVYTRAQAQFKILSLAENSWSDVSSREKAIERLKDLFAGLRKKSK